MHRHYVEVDGRRVFYRTAGSGPPLVMLHGSPGSSEMLEHEISAASAHFTCFALDTPGFGGSDPLPGEDLTVGDLAQATSAAMRHLGLPRCPVYGTHTGALIAVELGVHYPEQATGLVLEGLPIFTEAEMETLFEGYFAPMVTDPLGGHLISTWVRFRDQFIWFPWKSRDVTRLNPVDRPNPEEVHHWVMMFYRSFRSYIPAYRAACFHGHRAYLAVEALKLPAVFMASAEDMLFSHLDRLPLLGQGHRIERLPYDPEAKFSAIVGFALDLPQAMESANVVTQGVAGQDPGVQFLDAPHGQVFVRCYGDPASPPVILLHDGPGSGYALEETARKLAQANFVVLPDLPGCGESDNPATPDGSEYIAACAASISAIIDTLALEKVTIAATGCGCSVAAFLCQDQRIAEFVLENAPVPDPVIAASIAPDIALKPDGSHWVETWLMVRDGEIYAPWFDGTIAAQRQAQGDFAADWLHAQTFEIMKARTSYHRLPRAAWGFDTQALLAAANVPIRHGAILALSGASTWYN